MQKKKIEEALPFTIAALSAAAHSVQNHRHVIAKRFDKQAEVCDPMVAESPTSVRKEPRVMLLFSNNPTSSFESMGENPDACTMDNASVKL